MEGHFPCLRNVERSAGLLRRNYGTLQNLRRQRKNTPIHIPGKTRRITEGISGRFATAQYSLQIIAC